MPRSSPRSRAGSVSPMAARWPAWPTSRGRRWALTRGARSSFRARLPAGQAIPGLRSEAFQLRHRQRRAAGRRPRPERYERSATRQSSGLLQPGPHARRRPRRGEETAARASNPTWTRATGGSSLACTNLGYHYDTGLGTPANDARAAELYRRACDATPVKGGDLKGCYNLAISIAMARSAQERRRRRSLFARVCAGATSTPAPLGLMRETGEGIAKDKEGAVQAYGRRASWGISRPARTPAGSGALRAPWYDS